MSEFVGAELVFEEDARRTESLYHFLRGGGCRPLKRGFFAISEEQKPDFLRSFNLYENVGGQAERKTSSYGALGHETLGVCLRSINGEERRANIDKHQLGWIATYAVNQDYYNENGAQCYDFVRSCMTDEPRVAEKSDKQLRRLKDATIFWKNIFSSSDNPTIEVGDVAGLKGNILSNNPNAMGHVMIIAGEINGRAACISKLGTYEMPCIHSTDTAFHYYGGIPVVLNKKKLV